MTKKVVPSYRLNLLYFWLRRESRSHNGGGIPRKRGLKGKIMKKQTQEKRLREEQSKDEIRESEESDDTSSFWVVIFAGFSLAFSILRFVIQLI